VAQRPPFEKNFLKRGRPFIAERRGERKHPAKHEPPNNQLRRKTKARRGGFQQNNAKSKKTPQREPDKEKQRHKVKKRIRKTHAERDHRALPWKNKKSKKNHLGEIEKRPLVEDIRRGTGPKGWNSVEDKSRWKKEK